MKLKMIYGPMSWNVDLMHGLTGIFFCFFHGKVWFLRFQTGLESAKQWAWVGAWGGNSDAAEWKAGWVYKVLGEQPLWEFPFHIIILISYQLNIHESKMNEVLKPEKCWILLNTSNLLDSRAGSFSSIQCAVFVVSRFDQGCPNYIKWWKGMKRILLSNIIPRNRLVLYTWISP